MSRLDRIIAHVLVCNHKHCLKRGARASLKELRSTLREHGLRRSVIISTVECLDRCDDGPVVCVYPEGVWYRDVDESCAQRIVEEHLIKNRPVARHVLHEMERVQKMETASAEASDVEMDRDDEDGGEER